MASIFIGPVADLIGKALDKIFPDPVAAASAKVALLNAQNAGALQELEDEFKQDIAQLEVNKAEAQSGNIFEAGWRPAIGWICAAVFGYTYLVHPFVGDIATIAGSAVALPVLDIGGMMPVLLGILGLGALHTAERYRGVAQGQTDTEMPSYQPTAPTKKK